jgi:hypothetical protein
VTSFLISVITLRHRCCPTRQQQHSGHANLGLRRSPSVVAAAAQHVIRPAGPAASQHAVSQTQRVTPGQAVGHRDPTRTVTPLDITMTASPAWPRLPKDLHMLTPSFTLRDLQNGATPKTLAHGRELAQHIECLDWDEYSL